MARNFSVPPEGGLPPRPDLCALLKPPTPGRGEPRLRRWSTRIAEEAAVEVEAIARLEGLSVNALVMVALDRLLKDHGRPAISELAPWFPDYLLRRGGGERDRDQPPLMGEFD